MKKILDGIHGTILLLALLFIVMMILNAYQLEQIHSELTELHHEYLKSKIELQLEKLKQ